MVRDLISLADWPADDLLGLIDRADDLKALQDKDTLHRHLEGKTLALIFEKPSLRTRVTFQVGMYQLGGYSVLIDTALGERESVPDVARNLERWVDGIMARTFRHEDIELLAEHAGVPVINALTSKLHPCQILADAQALRWHKGGDFSSLKLAFVGDGNNVFHSWCNFAARIPFNVTLICPPGYEGDQAVVEFAQREAKGEVRITNDLADGIRDADAVYTDVWTSMGQEGEHESRLEAFRPFRVTSEVMAMAAPRAVFMHCLPAKRGLEVTDDVMDSDASIVFDQAECRLHAQKAVLVQLMG